MDLFHEIENAEAILRISGGTYRQVKVFHRGEKVFVNVPGGFARLLAPLGGEWGTSNPRVKVIDISKDVPGLCVERAPKYIADPALRAVENYNGNS